MQKLIEVEVIVYRFDISKPEECAEYETLSKMLKAHDYRLFRCYDGKPGTSLKKYAGTHQIETKILFSNQYNTAAKVEGENGLRIFDWYEQIYDNKNIIGGYYINPHGLERKVLNEMKKDRFVCGYCGAQYVTPDFGWCKKCRGSEYLHPDKYHLLKLVPLSAQNAWELRRTFERHTFENEIPEDVLADIKDQQKKSTEKRLKKQLERSLAAAKEKVMHAQREYDAISLLVAKGFTDIGNVIYYAYTEVFSFGWRRSLTIKEAEELRKFLEDFPYKYSIKLQK